MSQILTAQAAAMLQQYCSQLAKGYGIDPQSLKQQFSVVGPQETRLRQALLESADFLRMITLADVESWGWLRRFRNSACRLLSNLL